MSALAAAALALFADPNLGRDALYTPAGGGAAVALRTYLARPMDEPFGQGNGRTAAAIAYLAASALADAAIARPAKGATLAIGGTAWRVDGAELDPTGHTWKVTLQR